MIITLTSDFGIKDHYVGALKGMLLSQIPSVQLVDISHEIAAFTVLEAYYVVNSSYRYFPEKTLHLILVDSEINPDNAPVFVQWNNHYFLCGDNGILSLLTYEKPPELIVRLNYTSGVDATSFFVDKVAELVSGKSIFEMGEKVEKLKETQPLRAVVSEDESRITGSIIYVDNYGNAVSNISKELFESVRKGRDFEVSFRSYTITKIYSTYIDYASEKSAEIGGKLAIFNQSGLLEIALYRGSKHSGGTASSLLGISYQSSISVKFL